MIGKIALAAVLAPTALFAHWSNTTGGNGDSVDRKIRVRPHF